MKKHLLFLVSAWIIGTMGFGQELIENGDFELPDNDVAFQRIDSIPGWLTDDTAGGVTGREDLEGNAVGWQWDGTGSIYQVVGIVPSVETQYDISFDATCFYSYWSGDYVTDVYAILSAFPGEDTLARVPIDTITFTVSCIGGDWNQWVNKTGVFELEAGNVHAGENLVFEIDMFNSRDFGYDESWTYLYYDDVSVYLTQATAVKDLKNNNIKVISTHEMIRISGEKPIESAMIFDITGKRIMEVRPNSSQITLNVGHLKRGIYLITLFSNGERLTRKVVL